MNDTTITTGKVRLSYAHVFTPYSQNGGEAKYSCSLIIDKSDRETLAKIKKAVEAAKEQGATTKWGGKIPAKLKTPLHDADEDDKADDEAYAGHYYFNASSKRQPGLVDRNLEAIIDPNELYSGCYVRANINFYPFDFNGSRGVAAGLNHIQKLEDGEPLGGSAPSITAAFADDDDDFII